MMSIYTVWKDKLPPYWDLNEWFYFTMMNLFFYTKTKTIEE